MQKYSALTPTNLHRVSIVLYDADLQLLRDLVESTGVHTRSALIRLAIRALHATQGHVPHGDYQTLREDLARKAS